VAEGGNYRLQVKFEPGKIVVTEPNKVSVYVQEGGSPVFRYFNPDLNTAYFLEVMPGGKGLAAFKEGTAKNRTKLTLMSSAPAATGECKKGLIEIPVQNDAAVNPNKERLFGTHARDTLDVTGVYKTDGGHPIIDLKADGRGVAEMHGAPKPEYVYKVNWWLQANCDGSLVSTQYPAVRVYYVIFEYERPYLGSKFGRVGVQNRPDRMVIWGREKRL
jgi:hypothetical protein